MSRDSEIIPTIRETLHPAQKKAIELWGIVDEFRFADFILTNGELLGGLMGEHMEIASSVFEDEGEPLFAFLSTGVMRISAGIPGLGISIQIVREPSLEQVQTLRRAMNEYDSLNLEVTSSTGKYLKAYSQIKPGPKQLGDVINDVRRVIRTSST